VEITSVHDCFLLQKALDVVEVWAREWQFQLMKIHVIILKEIILNLNAVCKL